MSESAGQKLGVASGRWRVVVGALLVQAVLGTVYAFSVFVKPLEAEFGWSRATTQWAFSFALAASPTALALVLALAFAHSTEGSTRQENCVDEKLVSA